MHIVKFPGNLTLPLIPINMHQRKIQIWFCMQLYKLTLNITWKRKHGSSIMAILKVDHVIEFVGPEKDSFTSKEIKDVILA